MNADFFARHLAHVPVIAILRGMGLEATVQVAESCWDAGVELVEVPAQGRSGLRALEAAANAARERGLSVGAGTIYSVEDAVLARETGASFLVAPGLDEPTVRYAADEGIPYLPGVATPTEVQRAIALGLPTLKLFPAGPLGASWITALRGPFPSVQFVAVGGITPADGQEFLDAGAVGVGIGSALASHESVQALAALRGS